jgi:hypothetical protein
VLEPADAGLDQVAFLVDRLVEVELGRPRGIARDDCDGAGLCDGNAEVVGIVGGIGQDEAGPVLAEQGSRLRGIAALAGGQDDPDGAAEAAYGEVDLGAPATT